MIQSRGVWRAVLPPAIANWLAMRALESIPRNTLVEAFLCRGSERLIKSFTRRLSYLHDCSPAIEIVNEWLANDGWIGKTNCDFNSFGMEVFRNIAPVSPEKTLELIERVANGGEGHRFTSKENAYCSQFVWILKQLAFDPALFDRSANLLCRYTLSEELEEDRNPALEAIKPLFHIRFSGTHASLESRAKFIEQLLDSTDQDIQELGLTLLQAALETWYSRASHDPSFGAWPRDYGTWPRTRAEFKHWYETFIQICTRVALSHKSIARKARRILSDNFEGLWVRAGMYDALEKSATQIQDQETWNEGWIAVRSIICDFRKEFEKATLESLYRLDKLLKPSNLQDRARAFVLLNLSKLFDLQGEYDDCGETSSWGRLHETCRQIGIQVAQDMSTFKALLPELVSTRNIRLRSFGEGLADGCDDKQEIWRILRSQLENTPVKERSIEVFRGFLSSCEENDSAFYNSTLDDLIKDSLLGEWFPLFQAISTIDERGLQRLCEALDADKAKIDTFDYFGIAPGSISDDDLAVLLRKIISKEGGIDVAIEIIAMRFYQADKETPDFSISLVEVAREILLTYSFPDNWPRQRNPDHSLMQIAQICFKGDGGFDFASKMCRHLAEAMVDDPIDVLHYPNLLKVLALNYPFVFLDVFLGDDVIGDYQLGRVFAHYFEWHDNPLEQISDDDLLSWCELEPENHYPIIVKAIKVFSESTETKELAWQPIIYTIFDRAPNLDVLLQQLVEPIRPISWDGSYAEALRRRVILFESLYEHANVKIRAWARAQLSALEERIKRESEREGRENRERYESFE